MRTCGRSVAATSPGARQRCFLDLLTEEGTFRSVDEMVSLVRASGADPAEIRATYCQGGVRAALVWFVLHELAGFDQVRNYAGSWEEWGNRADSPMRMYAAEQGRGRPSAAAGIDRRGGAAGLRGILARGAALGRPTSPGPRPPGVPRSGVAQW